MSYLPSYGGEVLVESVTVCALGSVTLSLLLHLIHFLQGGADHVATEVCVLPQDTDAFLVGWHLIAMATRIVHHSIY